MYVVHRFCEQITIYFCEFHKYNFDYFVSLTFFRLNKMFKDNNNKNNHTI